MNAKDFAAVFVVFVFVAATGVVVVLVLNKLIDIFLPGW